MDPQAIEDIFAPFGPVTTRRMFGGTGIYHKGVIIALEAYGEILLKADAVSRPDFEAAGACQWVYEGKGGKPAAMPYWSVPDTALDDAEEFARWAQKAYEAGLRAKT